MSRSDDPSTGAEERRFQQALAGLSAGDFTALAPLFAPGDAPSGDTPGRAGGGASQIEAWFLEDHFLDQPGAAAEAVACACFLGRTQVAAFLLDRGVDPAAGMATGMSALHYAASAGHLDVVKLLIQRGAPMELKNRFGGTVLDQALYSALNEPRPDHPRIIEALLAAGADAEAVGGLEAVREVLRRHERSHS